VPTISFVTSVVPRFPRFPVPSHSANLRYHPWTIRTERRPTREVFGLNDRGFFDRLQKVIVDVISTVSIRYSKTKDETAKATHLRLVLVATICALAGCERSTHVRVEGGTAPVLSFREVESWRVL
jgi:hypothetical protein